MEPGDLISGKYRLLRLLGSGGMGSVWAARNELTDRDFAVKFLLHDLAKNKEALNRFFLEARACGQIKHPAVVAVYDMGQADDGAPFLVMELLEGEGFDERLLRAGAFPPVEAAAWIAFVARGLDEAHVRGLVHRDLKPGNIFFALDDRGVVLPKLLDFGVSKATGANKDIDFVKTTTGAVLGSPSYMSPEQAKGESDIDGRSDVWSLGVILYEAITGKVPFDAGNYNALMLTIITRQHQPVADLAPGVPPALSAVIDAAMTKDRTKRIGTARELAERLEAIIAQSPDAPSLPNAAGFDRTPFPSRGPQFQSKSFATTQGSWAESKTLRRGRSPLLWISASMLAAALLAAGAVALLRLRPPMVAVAGRSAIAMTTGLAHLRQQIEQIKLDAAAEAKAKAAAAAAAEELVLEPSELPPPSSVHASATARPSAPPSGSGKPAGKTPKGAKGPGDGSSGVESAGF